ncbi:MAG: nuclear transport factor 2 family protein [Halieaceae bacterium]|nr:nuclear transport factor 2 family protein [Halieaceae bacterium]
MSSCSAVRWRRHVRPGALENDHCSQELWEAQDADLVFSRYEMTWTGKQTGRSVTQPVVELNHFRDGKLARMEVFMSNLQGLMATLDEESG